MAMKMRRMLDCLAVYKSVEWRYNIYNNGEHVMEHKAIKVLVMNTTMSLMHLINISDFDAFVWPYGYYSRQKVSELL
jgi:hypothetical protein